ncbi:4'-phosphopantetheinyl transferase superfamily protein [Streptomyces cinnabarinus]|uniref:4'-phosphopantetheinyl transferase superfamily protein n=1 Tax=Streptomyces cinnabarinus TaxID=67287 RepID=A0ABY7KJK9_9ACTN|nr:4'-phosphopantetheinyl transferase superfamily protein [Streptomyces cinnabarinus]WAZ22916.1 4'-phosphopantetheinyl transferase superfamily protein [Streptomyces cinnabarinus]
MSAVLPAPVSVSASGDPEPVDLAAVTALFEPRVIAAQAHTGELDFAQLPEPTRRLLRGYTAPLRRETFTAGRLAAARATAALTGMPRWLSADARGAPSWPYGVAGSLSHTNRVALCVTGPADGVGLGIDIEPLETGPELLSALHYVCTPEESERLRDVPDPARAVLRLFCVKEALYKALPPDTQDGVSFQSVDLEWEEPPAGRDPGEPVLLRVARGPAPGTEGRCAVLGSRMIAAVAVSWPRRSRSCTRPDPRLDPPIQQDGL